MNEINLLPQELKPSGSVLKMAKNLKGFAIIAVVVSLISLTFSIAGHFILNQRISASLSVQEDLKTQIKTLESTEQKIVLVKDRLEKINSIVKKPRANDEVERLNIVSDLYPENTLVERVDLSELNAIVAISSENLDNVAAYLASVISSGKYIQINLVSLKFDLINGYVIELAFPGSV